MQSHASSCKLMQAHAVSLLNLRFTANSFVAKGLLTALLNLQFLAGVLHSQQDESVQKQINTATHRLDFGSLQVNKVYTKSFSVKNPFSVDVTVESVQSSCGCAVPSLRSNIVGASDSFEGEVSLTAPGYSGSIGKQIVLNGKSQDLPFELVLELIGEVHEILEIKGDSKWPIYSPNSPGANGPKNDYRFQIRNYFVEGHFPIVSVDNAKVKEIREVEIHESLAASGVVGVWEVVLSKPPVWKRIIGFPNMVELKVQQEDQSGNVWRANSSILIETARAVIFRPRVLRLSDNEEDVCSCEIFVRELEVKDLTFSAIGIDRQVILPIRNQRTEGRFFRFELLRSQWREILEDGDRIQVSFGNEENFWEYSK